ncbi:nucleotidyltransferase domain-containing protein [Calidithermus chliarophilus]|uniref:nucleotidyltransferase domain-containing protein n=1 Tax=Calidithermus chliarophilus TaxID=52023 RepID=UPI00040BB67F|nr:nucleotidyltransferase domain-containing protein [Calidithermus chliarophilus]
MYPNPDVQEVVEALAAGIREALGAGLEGLYLRGSLALGDFDPASSDVDLLAVTRTPVTGAEFAALSAVHSRVQALDNPYAAEVELAYVPLELLANFVPKTRVPALERGCGRALGWKALGANWLLEFWAVREHGVALHGPHPKALIGPVPPWALRQAVRQVLPDWLEWAGTTARREMLGHAGLARFAVETMCRALLTLETGEMGTKPRAVRWALGRWPGWAPLLERSRAWKAGQPLSEAAVDEVLAFIRAVAREGLSPEPPLEG